MSKSFGNRELQLFQSVIARRLGLRFDDGKLSFLAEVLTERSEAQRLDPSAYLEALEAEREATAELSELVRRLTVGETYFFRHSEQFNAVRELVLPERAAARGQSRSMRLLSVGCASGEEAYTLAILVREHLPPAFDVDIRGLDVNPDSLAKARAGLYSSWSLRETPADVRQRWFTPEDRNFRLAPALREAVRFSEQNLVDASMTGLPPETYDVIFCRNVLMYFTPEHMANIVEHLTRALVPGGYLFLGHAETLRGLSQAFHLRHTHNTFYYQRKEGAEASEPVVFATLPLPRDEPRAAPSGEWLGAAWLESVERSSDRIRVLSDAGHEAQPASAVEKAAAGAQRHLKEPLELLRNERFSEALALLHRLPEAQSNDPSALLLRAALLTHQGDLGPAELACQRLLEVDELNAGAHYLLALCRERQDDLPAAAEHDLTAIYLDSGFAMPHLHLGLMARRRRDVDVARRELTQALWLLEREDDSRLLLFGGGFARNALLALCRSELERLKGSS